MKLGETVTFDFVTHNLTTGAISDADSTPTVSIYKNDVDTAIATPTAVKRTGLTGNYRVSFLLDPNIGFENEQSFNIVAIAIVGGVAAKSVIAQFVLEMGDGYMPSSLSDCVA